MQKIRIRGARTHNLKNINLELDRNQLVVITGLSGSGKSSLAFDTLFAEGQRRYVESLSAYARQFLSVMDKPDVDLIEGLSPAISIEQKSTSHNPRSTVGTVTEVYDYLRLLLARVGEARCPDHDTPLRAQTVDEIVDALTAQPAETRLIITAPVVSEQKGEHGKLLDELRRQGYARVLINGDMHDLADPIKLEKNKKSTIEVVIDRLKMRKDIAQRLADSLETALAQGEGLVHAYIGDTSAAPMLFSANHACPHCNYSIEALEPKMFSFNSPAGACQKCDGLGQYQHFDSNRLIADNSLSLSEGVIPGWDPSRAYYFFLLRCTAKHFDIDLEKPWKKLSAKHQKIILYGSGEEKVSFRWSSKRMKISRERPFEGVIPNMQRRYHETESAHAHEGLKRFMIARPCEECNGSRLRREARHVFIAGHAIHKITALPIDQCYEWMESLKLQGWRAEVAEQILRELRRRLHFLVEVGLGYLSLDRSAETLSGGEAQRIRLASQIGAGLVGVMYILDEPSIGLHQRDNNRLLNSLLRLRDLGNTVLVVEHDEECIRTADSVVDIGPGAGIHGGEICAQGTPDEIAKNPRSITGAFLSGRQQIAVPKHRRKSSDQWLEVLGASGNNLQDAHLRIPVGLLTCVTGVSGSGKSTLINQTLYPHAAMQVSRAQVDEPAPCNGTEGLGEHLDKVIDIDQSPIGRTPRSNPATYTGMFTPIRELFAATEDARARGYKIGRFSFNVPGGRCEACSGDGLIKVEMHFLADVYVPCDECGGKRYNRDTLQVTYKGKNIHEVLQMTVEEALEFFSVIPQIAKRLQTLFDVGLSYISLGQPATTLSGGEAQRIKLAKELARRDTGRTLYTLDEPTTGLHFQDVRMLVGVLQELCNRGNTIVVIEHNLDVIKSADWIVDLGPEGGAGGGQIIAAGTPEAVSKVAKSYTGNYLKKMLKPIAKAKTAVSGKTSRKAS